MVLQGCSTAELKMQMIAEGVKTLRMAAMAKAFEGVITLEEVLRVTSADKS
jgi:type IV pilus assembly protein PilB